MHARRRASRGQRQGLAARISAGLALDTAALNCIHVLQRLPWTQVAGACTAQFTSWDAGVFSDSILSD